MGGGRHSRLAVSACVIAALAIPNGGLVFAKSVTEELGTDDAAILGKVKSSNVWGGDGSIEGTGGVAYMPALGAPPKRVALVSFYVWDCGNSKTRVYHTYSATYRSTREYTVVGVEGIAEVLYVLGIGPLNETFARHVMLLLTPGEFLDTDAKRSAYQAFEIEQSAMAKFAGHFQKDAPKGIRIDGAPAEYRLLKVITNNNAERNDFMLAAKGGDGKLFEGLGHHLAGQLGVDAVALFYNVVQGEKERVELLSSYLYLFGPNPVKDASPSRSWSGHQYAGHYLKIDATIMKTTKEGNAAEVDIAGFDRVTRALGERTGQYIEEEIHPAK